MTGIGDPRSAQDPFFLRNLLVAITVAMLVGRLFAEYWLEEYGFAAKPYANAAIYLASAIVVAPRLVNLRPAAASSRFWLWFVLVSLCYALSLSIGVYLGNSTTYIIAWSIYVLAGLAMTLVVGGMDRRSFEEMISVAVMSDAVLAGIIITNVLAASFLGNLYAVLDWLSVSVLLTRIAVESWSLRNIALVGAIILPHVLSGGVEEITISRSFLLMSVAMFIVYYMFLRKPFRIILVVSSVFLATLYLLNMDYRDVQQLPRNVSEGIFLLKGDALENHISTAQRFLEVEAVEADLSRYAPWSYFSGMGLGRTVDMSLSSDESVKNAALLGATEVNTIHFLPYALLHKFGLFGLGLFCLMLVTLSVRFVRVALTGSPTPSQMFGYLYVYGCIAYALSASNHFISDPIWPLLFSGLIAGHYAVRRMVHKDDLPTDVIRPPAPQSS